MKIYFDYQPGLMELTYLEQLVEKNKLPGVIHCSGHSYKYNKDYIEVKFVSPEDELMFRLVLGNDANIAKSIGKLRTERTSRFIQQMVDSINNRRSQDK